MFKSLSNVIKNLIDKTDKSVHCAFWDLDLDDLINSFGDKSKSSDVKLIIDKRNYEDQIIGDGIKIAESSRYMHNKFCIIDGKKVDNIESIDQNSIESISVLKDAAGKSLYGDKAENGVVIITTKAPKKEFQKKN